MKLAVMQPYFLPHIGYFQLMNVVDRFVFLDDVNYINKGWINKNRVLVNNREYTFTIPIKEVSQNRKINKLFLVEEEKWKKKLSKTLEYSYSKAPYFQSTFSLINELIHSKEKNLSKYILNSIEELIKYLGIDTEIKSSSVYGNTILKSQDRILDICRKENTDIYINATGGIDLYSREEFGRKGIELKFIGPLKIEYPQFDGPFVSSLSIIDVMMFNSKEKIKSLLNQYEIL